jgi:hypothetical protein
LQTNRKAKLNHAIKPTNLNHPSLEPFFGWLCTYTKLYAINNGTWQSLCSDLEAHEIQLGMFDSYSPGFSNASQKYKMPGGVAPQYIFFQKIWCVIA